MHEPEAEYLDREPALEAERVIARSRVGPSGPSKGGTAGLKACPLELRKGSQRTGFLLAGDDFGSFEKEGPGKGPGRNETREKEPAANERKEQ